MPRIFPAFRFGGVLFVGPSSDGSANQALVTDGAGNTSYGAVGDLTTDAVDAITEIAAALRTGSDSELVTGTAGTSGNLLKWNADGDAIDSGSSASDFAAASHTHAAGDVVSGTFADARIAQSNVTQHQGAIDHDALTNFVANEHVDHSSVSISAGTGLSGGGDLTQTRTLNVNDVETLPTSTTAGSVIFSDGNNLTEDNTNLFWDDTNDRLGIGTNSPGSKLHVFGSAFDPVIIERENNSSFAQALSFRKSRGASSGVVSGDELARIASIGKLDDGTFPDPAGNQDFLSVEATETHTTSAQGRTVQFFVVNNGNTSKTESLTLEQNANVIVPNGNLGAKETSPTALIHIAAGTSSNPPLKFTAGTNLSTAEAGATEFDGAALAFTPASDRRSISLADGVIIADTTVANTVTETTIFTESVSADELFKGSKWHTRISGYYSTANGTDTFTFRLKIGGTTILSVTSTAENVTDGFWRGEFFFTVRSTGGSGTVQAAFEGVFNDNPKNVANTSTDIVDTTSAADITATVEWSAADAGNTLSITQGHSDVFGVTQA